MVNKLITFLVVKGNDIKIIDRQYDKVVIVGGNVEKLIADSNEFFDIHKLEVNIKNIDGNYWYSLYSKNERLFDLLLDDGTYKNKSINTIINLTERPSKDEYYLILAEAAQTRGSCLRRSFGAVIVKDDRVISTGYTGQVTGEPNCVDVGKCYRQEQGIPSGQRYEVCKSLHAEWNAIINAGRELCKGSTIYIVGKDMNTKKYTDAIPCEICKKLIKESGIIRVVYRNAEGNMEVLTNQTYGG